MSRWSAGLKWGVLAKVIALATWACAQTPLVYESMSHTNGTGELHGKTADAGLGAWNVTPSGAGQIIAPTMIYTDGNGNVLPVTGSRFETVFGFNDYARAAIDATPWSDANRDGGKLNKRGATIWFSVLMRAQSSMYNHFHLDFTDTADANASYASGPGYFAVGKHTNNSSWELRGDNDDGDADQQVYATASSTVDTFIVGRLTTDAVSGDTTLDVWFDPLLDTAPGAADATITVPANDDGSVTQFDTVGYRHQKWESPNALDEIRMDESFAGVVGDLPGPETGLLIYIR